jgi:nicotinate-nucleotide adenylyltransferase
MLFGKSKVPRIKKRVALFGGSFDPPHVGHTEICKWIFARGIADEVWVVPCFIHPFAKKMSPFEDRYTMCCLALDKLSLTIDVLKVEKELGDISHTLRTIKYLQEKYPDYSFTLITGGDIEAQSEDWHNFDEIRELVEVMHIPRGLGSPIPDISSTQIRKNIEVGEPIMDLVEDEVAVYIVTKQLYR